MGSVTITWHEYWSKALSTLQHVAVGVLLCHWRWRRSGAMLPERKAGSQWHCSTGSGTRPEASTAHQPASWGRAAICSWWESDCLRVLHSQTCVRAPQLWSSRAKKWWWWWWWWRRLQWRQLYYTHWWGLEKHRLDKEFCSSDTQMLGVKGQPCCVISERMRYSVCGKLSSHRFIFCFCPYQDCFCKHLLKY